MPGSLLRRISRYGISASKDAREDRLTEICAALLSSARCPGLAEHVALGWLAGATLQAGGNAEQLAALNALLADDDPDWRCEIRTQFRIEAGGEVRRPDLELRFSWHRSDGRVESVVLWVEVKHGTGPHSQQLQAYVDAQRARRLGHAAVLLIAPRGDIPSFDPEEIPAEVPVLTWQETAQRLAAYPPPDDVARYLVVEFCAYLKEEGLMDPEQLSPVHLVALANYREALNALDRICDIAAEEVSRRWNQGEPPGRWPSIGPRSQKTSRWWPYPSCPMGGSAAVSDDWSWDFEQLDDSASVLLDGRAGVPCLTVGMSAEAESGAMAALGDAQRAALEQAGFSLLALGDTTSDKYVYVWRVAYPEEVLTGRDLRSQAEALASWIIDGFMALHAAMSAAS